MASVRSGLPMTSAVRYQRSRSPKRGSKTVAMLPPVKSLLFAPPPESSGPVKNWALSYQDKPLVLEVSNVYSPFDPSSLTEATRLTLTLRLPSDWDSAWDCFEAALFHEMVERSAEFFGRVLSEEELVGMYKPITKKVEEYPRNLRVKCNTQGSYRTRYWGADKQPVDTPATHAGEFFNARVVLRGVWVGESAFGLVADCTDLQLIDEAAPVCPF